MALIGVALIEQTKIPHMRPFVQLLLLATAAWAVIYGRYALGALQETMRLDLTLSDNQIAWLQGPAVAVPMALGAIPLGLLIDRYSRVHLMLVFLTVNLASTILTAFAFDPFFLFAGRVMSGIALAAILVTAYSMVADLYAPAQRGRATMVVGIGEISGAPIAFALGGMLLAGMGSAAESWRGALLWMSAPLLAVLIVTIKLREPVRSDVIVHNPELRHVWTELWRCRGIVVALLLARVMVWIADGAVLVWGAPTFARTYGLTPERIGLLMAVALLVAGLLGPALGGPLADLCHRTGGPRRTVGAMSIIALMGTPGALFGLMPSSTLAIVALTCLLTFGFSIGTASLALATVVLPGELRALFLGISFTVGAIFSIGLAPLVVSGLSTAMGGGPSTIGEALAVVCGVTSILGSAVFAIGRRYFPDKRDPSRHGATHEVAP